MILGDKGVDEDTLTTGDTHAAPHGASVAAIDIAVPVGTECVRFVRASS